MISHQLNPELFATKFSIKDKEKELKDYSGLYREFYDIPMNAKFEDSNSKNTQSRSPMILRSMPNETKWSQSILFNQKS